MKKHNGIISLWKFAFCLLILIFHVGEFAPKGQFVLFKNGSIGVEFFFIVSGYFMAKKALEKNKKNETIGEETFHYVWNRLKALIPYIIITYIFAIIIKSAFGQMTIKNYILSFWDLTLLKFVGFKATNIVNHLWYIAAMLLCMAILYPQIKKFGKNYFYLIAPLSIILISGYMCQTYGNLRDPHMWIGFMYKGTLRAYFELALGSLLYPLVQKIKKVDFTKIGQYILTAIEIGGFSIIFIVSHFLSTSYDYILVVILAISILIALSEKTLEYNICNNKVFYYLEKLSLTMYFIHLPIRNLLRDCYLKTGVYLNYWYQLIGVLFISFILGVIMIWFVDYLKKHDYFKPVLKKILIQDKYQEEA